MPVTLAFSGGLDTSYCVPRLIEDGWAVHTVYVNTGGSSPEDRAAIAKQASDVGATQHHEIDAREEVYHRFVRFLTAYLPETRDGEPAPLALEYAFSPSLSEALDLMREVVTESPSGYGAALYVHDLDTGLSS